MKKTMKKLMTLIPAFVVACSLAACGSNAENSTNGAKDDGSNLAEGLGDGFATMDCEFLYGKITSITGNEIELALAEMPDMDVPAAKEGSGSDAGDIPDGAIGGPAQPLDSMDEGGGNMEYTGETLNIMLPVGVKFYSMGQETTLSALKKGSLVSIVVDNLEDMNIQVVDIMME